MTERNIKDTEKLIDFIHKSPSCYHVVENIRRELTLAGYSELTESSSWSIKNGGRYFVIRNMSSIIAFNVPENDFEGFMICAAHSDSPTFKIKPNPEMEAEGAYIKLNTEAYGGMIMSSWLDRPLSVAGRAVIETDNGIEARLVNIDRDFCIIPNVAIHMNRDLNKGYEWNPQSDMLPLIGDITAKNSFIREVAACAQTDVKSILGYDLFLYNRQKGVVWGVDNEYYSSPKIDDLQCAYSSIKALLKSENKNMITMAVIFDNEEVGSGTKQGALSNFLIGTLERINEAAGRSNSLLYEVLASSFMLSADNGHAVHPNKTDKACPTNRPRMNGGVVIKHNANQKYTTDGIAEAALIKILKKAGIPYQTYTNRSDIAGGSTLGNLSTEKVSINTADIGMAQLAMHSCYETGGTNDTTLLIDAMTEFFNSQIKEITCGVYTITTRL